VVAIAGLEQLPTECRIIILNFLRRADLVSVSVVSRQLHEDCWSEWIDNKIIPAYEIIPRTPSPQRCGFFSTAAMLCLLCHNQINNNDRFSRYTHLKVHRVNELCSISAPDVRTVVTNWVENSDDQVRVDRVLSLDISVPPRATQVYGSAITALASLMPNVREVDLSNIRLRDESRLVSMFQDTFSSLEKLTWNRSEECPSSGYPFRNCDQLKEIIMDDSFFPITRNLLHKLLDLTGHDDIFMLRYCKTIERLSIRRAKWRRPGKEHNEDIPQSVLVKFARRAPPSLRWFRSDLTKENIAMLRKERPMVEFLN